ncbi:hypothetical protein BHE90_009181 [Fusarium euwallaceae]|uniref:Uncharacterized protein n=3 Tax=Fusarium solani species complex TaxID=232080 RepID=A0A3M2S991_9HYPO|nr:hypothetical protein CDV36_006213 [Fusarium kuroshium]RSM02170.1 hypothetical protein CEP52_008117 [Fusarium oligoseptatum]RTE76349.1 hypothetical protein BHE90_009181 [Fusarium euwallaceae]
MLVPERSDMAWYSMASGTGPLNWGEQRLKRGLRLADEDTEPKTGLYIKGVVLVLARRGQADTVGYQEIPKLPRHMLAVLVLRLAATLRFRWTVGDLAAEQHRH